MIKDLLPAYYEIYGTNLSYTALRIITIDGHEVSWMEFIGATGEGDQHRTYIGRALYCECNFTKGVGWDVGEDGKPHGLFGSDKCLRRKTAVHLRHLELRKEYLEKFGGDLFFVQKHIPEIVADLIEKAKADEFLEDGSGAMFWGGYFYLQTLAVIVDLPMNAIWKEADLLVKNKKISLEGAVVQDYREPPPPEWDECFKGEISGWTVIASLPRHRTMPKAWKLEVVNSKGELVCTEILALGFDPVFGPDVSDIENANHKLQELVRKAMRKRKK